MTKCEFLRLYKKHNITKVVLSHEPSVPRVFLQKDTGMVTPRGTATRAFLYTRGHPKEKGKCPELDFFYYFHLFLTSISFSS